MATRAEMDTAEQRQALRDRLQRALRPETDTERDVVNFVALPTEQLTALVTMVERATGTGAWAPPDRPRAVR